MTPRVSVPDARIWVAVLVFVPDSTDWSASLFRMAGEWVGRGGVVRWRGRDRRETQNRGQELEQRWLLVCWLVVGDIVGSWRGCFASQF